MTMFPSNHKRHGISTGVVGENDCTNETDPLWTPSSSTTYLGSFYEPQEIPEVDLLLVVGEGAVKKKRKPRRGEDFTFREAVVKADFWFLWSVYFLGVGLGVTVLNNLAQIGVSLGVNDATVLLSLFSFCNFLGRLGAGVVKDDSSNILLGCRTSTHGRVIFSMRFSSKRYSLRCRSVAWNLLRQFSVMIPTASKLFGLEDFGVIFNFMQLGNPVGALVFSSLLASQVYESEAAKQFLRGSKLLPAHVPCFSWDLWFGNVNEHSAKHKNTTSYADACIRLFTALMRLTLILLVDKLAVEGCFDCQMLLCIYILLVSLYMDLSYCIVVNMIWPDSTLASESTQIEPELREPNMGQGKCSQQSHLSVCV
ncbi:hypothetical protein SASPL_114924 [Salvia splendens]|uniref:NFD4 C-terminal domain-containing protein n=1 Tax=Salvia splendens TaxID=180675 RepID=A0A8X8Y1J8_SALSN|nr:hypothetical protein SASPL_114924 [Salvia splendens]